jgi:hypothetical protein
MIPRHLSDELLQLNTTFEFQSSIPDSYCFDVIINNEKLEIPYRIYVNPPSKEQVDQIPIKKQQIMSCFLTRHHNGHIREQFLKNIILNKEPWVVPFISQLIGEYVFEILFEINSKLEQMEIKEFVKFFNDNPLFFFRMKQRVISYWDCYYRNEYTDFNDYIGNRIIKYFESESGRGNYT